MMASKTTSITSIPRFLLPQHGPMWRAAVRTAAFARPRDADVGQVMVRYASSRTALASASTSRRPTTAAKSAVTRTAAQRTASTKSAAASKAAKHSAPVKPPPKSAAKPAVTKAAASQQKTAAPPPKPVPAKPTAPASTSAPTKSEPAAAQPVTPKPVAPKPAAAAPAAAADPSKPLVLEKPERFNPPSHGSRLPRSTPRHYGGSLTAEEVQAQNQKSYPGLPPPPNTWSHWFINSRGVHMFITLGTLTSLAIYTFAANFQAKSPFADLIPPISEFPRHPFQYIGVCVDVLRMHEEHESALTAEKRRRRVEDVTKRNEYRKAHGLEPATSGLFGLGSGSSGNAETSPDANADDASPRAITSTTTTTTTSVESSEPDPSAAAAVAAEFTPEGKRKKFLGIF